MKSFPCCPGYIISNMQPTVDAAKAYLDRTIKTPFSRPSVKVMTDDHSRLVEIHERVGGVWSQTYPAAKAGR